MASVSTLQRQPIATSVYELLIKPADKNNDQTLNKTELESFKQFIANNKLSKAEDQKNRETAVNDLITYFDLFDADGNGEINRADIRRVATIDKRNWEMSAADLGLNNEDSVDETPSHQPAHRSSCNSGCGSQGIRRLPRYDRSPDDAGYDSQPQSFKQKLIQLLLPFILIMLLGRGHLTR